MKRTGGLAQRFFSEQEEGRSSQGQNLVLFVRNILVPRIMPSIRQLPGGFVSFWGRSAGTFIYHISLTTSVLLTRGRAFDQRVLE